jgi:hypothetical protein
MKTLGEAIGDIVDEVGNYRLPDGYETAIDLKGDVLVVRLNPVAGSDNTACLVFGVCVCPKHRGGSVDAFNEGMGQALEMLTSTPDPKPVYSTRDSVLRFLRRKRA